LPADAAAIYNRAVPPLRKPLAREHAVMSSFDDIFPSLLVQMIRWIAVQSPIFLVWLAGIVIAIARWRRHPTVSLLTAGACGALLLTTVIQVVVFQWLPRWLIDRGSSADIGEIFLVISVLFCGIRAVCWGVILLALFGWRSPMPVALPYRIPPGGHGVGR